MQLAPNLLGFTPRQTAADAIGVVPAGQFSGRRSTPIRLQQSGYGVNLRS
jgi:hypothetical protein